MGKIHPNRRTGAHSGRASRKDNLYTKVNRKTGKCYSAKLLHPVTTFTEEQKKLCNTFGILSKALSAWVIAQKTEPSKEYKVLMRRFKKQTNYTSLRGMMMGKKMAAVKDNTTVTVTVGDMAFDIKLDGTMVSNAPAAV